MYTQWMQADIMTTADEDACIVGHHRAPAYMSLLSV